MTGRHKVYIHSKKLNYELELRRNITVIRGDSGTGKTTLIRMIMLSRRKNSPYTVTCDKECIAFTVDSFTEQTNLSEYKDSILFLDEDIDFVKTKDFARIVKSSSCYFVIATRETLDTLPYSCKEVYKLQQNKLVSQDKLINDCMHEIYNISSKPKVCLDDILSCIIVEDKKSGYRFFKKVADSIGVECISAEGKANVTRVYRKRLEENKDTGILIIVDGAAFGAQFEELHEEIKRFYSTIIYLPESFEFVLLRSGLVSAEGLEDKLMNTCNYAESSEYFSWERYFTQLLQDISRNTDFEYTKSELNPNYLKKSSMNKIKKIIPSGIGISKNRSEIKL